MRFLGRRGQSTGEYAILFAIVLGGVVAMQSYVRDRISDKIQTEADSAFGSTAPSGLPSRTSDSVSRSKAKMDTASKGVVQSDSDSRSVQ